MIAYQSPYRRTARGVLARPVTRAAGGSTGRRRVAVCKVLWVNGVKEIEVAVTRELRIEREARQAQRADSAYFVRQVDERLAGHCCGGEEPDPTGALPHEHAAVVGERNSGGIVPGPPVRPVHRRVGKPRRKRTRSRCVARSDEQQGSENR